MENQKIIKWLNERSITLETGFVPSLRLLAKTYQKENSICTINDVYKLIGTSKQCVSYWEKHQYSTQIKKIQNLM